MPQFLGGTMRTTPNGMGQNWQQPKWSPQQMQQNIGSLGSSYRPQQSMYVGSELPNQPAQPSQPQMQASPQMPAVSSFATSSTGQRQMQSPNIGTGLGQQRANYLMNQSAYTGQGRQQGGATAAGRAQEAARAAAGAAQQSQYLAQNKQRNDAINTANGSYAAYLQNTGNGARQMAVPGAIALPAGMSEQDWNVAMGRTPEQQAMRAKKAADAAYFAENEKRTKAMYGDSFLGY